MITCVGIAGADTSSANWHADAGDSITGIDSDNNQTEIGVLIIAHGSSSESWCAPVRATVANVSLPYPVELGFLEKVPGESIEDAVDKLSSHGVSEIVAVPLFVSSSSNHIGEIEYILGLGDAIPGEEDLVQVNTTANITLIGAMDDHWIISSILADNAAEFGEDPCNETAVLVSHGVSDDEAIFVGWNESSASLAEQTLLRLRHIHNLDIKGVRYSFINLNETLRPEFAARAVVEEISSDSTPIVLSRILSPGYHTKKKIPALLENLTYLYDNETTLATHPALAEWIDVSVYEAVSDLSFSVYDGENGEIVELTIEDAVAGHEGGKICPCVAVAWRASQFALSEVWSDVDQSDLKITSAHPSDGHEETFLYILNNSTADYTIEMPEGTDPKNLTTDNYVYTFTSKSTGDSVTVHVKDDVFPDKLFDLRKKCKAGTATPDEKKAFKLIKDELKDGFLYLPMDELFDAEVEHTRSDTGVLIIAHGSSSESWCAPVRAAAGNVDLPYPVELGFLEGVPGESIEDAIDKLSNHGVSEIVAVPLFVSSSSNHIGEIEYILGLGDAIPGEEDLVQVNITANITLTGAMDDHWIISSILADHAADLSEDPCNETVVTISHGVSNNEEIFAGWNESGASLAGQTLLRLRYLHNLDIGGSRYSLARLNETLHPEIAARAVVEDVSATSTPVVLPLFLSTGYNTNTKIPTLLENLTYLYDNETTLATHPALAEWIDISVYEAVSDLSFSVYDGESGEIVELTLEEAVAGHEGGKLCPCVAVAWRASQFALSEVWSDVDQSDLKITSAHPSDGHEETFLYILNNSTADYTIEMPEGTDPKNLTTENYVYTFTSKSTGDSVTVHVKDDVFPDKLFDLRKKCKAGTATPDEKKAFKLIKDELKDGFLYLPMDELFDAEVEQVQSDTGVLLIAHGSSSESWCAPVRATVANVSLPYPVELGFLEGVLGESIEDAVDKLSSHGVSEIVAVPLFVSSSSNHIGEIEYILGLGDAIPGEDDLVQVNTTANITLTGAMDDHWIISSILADHAADLSEDPCNETVVTISHGVSDNEEIFAGWNESGESLAEQTLLRLRYLHNLDIGGSRYSLARLNETLHPEIAARAVVEDVSATSTPVVLPLFLSPGYNTNTKIPAMLENLTYVYDSEKTLAAHPALAEWIDISVYEAVSDLSFSVYDGESGEIVELTIGGAAAMHDGGKLCPSVAASWRASQLALSDIWGCIPRSDLEITSAHPSDGHEATFLYILENSTDDYVVEMPEGTDTTNLSTENYVYTFVRKSTGDSVTVRVKDDVIPAEFLELRKKIRAKTATPEEIKVFKLIKDELKARLMYLPACELFDSEVAYSKFDTGILVVAHGSPREMWCAPVRAAAHNVDLPYPVELGFLEFAPGETINAAVDRLDKHGVKKIIAVPLFVSSNSDHIAEVEYVLGLRDSLPGAHSASEMGVMSSADERAGMITFASGKEVMRSVVQRGDRYFISRVAVAGHPGGDEEEELVPVKTDAAITLTGAIDDHWLVGEILADRARALSTNPEGETVVLVAHGADNETDIVGWINDSMSLAEQVDLRLRFVSEEPALDLAGVRYSFLFHNETLHPDIKTRAVVEDVSTTSDALVVPFMVSPGFFTETFIPQMELANLTYAYDGDALLPHPKIADLIEIKASEEFTDLAFPVYDGESDKTVNLTINEAAAGHDDGELCLCVAVSFRASQFALSEVWSDVDRCDLEITSAHPSDGHEATFLYILNNSTADYTVDMPEGTDPKNLTKENYVYTFTRKSTGESITVRVKDGVFHDELFELRKKCKAGTATPDEKKVFKLIKRELKDRFMYLPICGLFETQSPSPNGDVNGDGAVTTTDATIALEMATSGEWTDVADVNGAGRVPSLNALMILRTAADKIEV